MQCSSQSPKCRMACRATDPFTFKRSLTTEGVISLAWVHQELNDITWWLPWQGASYMDEENYKMDGFFFSNSKGKECQIFVIFEKNGKWLAGVMNHPTSLLKVVCLWNLFQHLVVSGLTSRINRFPEAKKSWERQASTWLVVLVGTLQLVLVVATAVAVVVVVEVIFMCSNFTHL